MKFEAAIQDIISHGTPSSGDNLIGMIIDVEHALSEVAGWENVEVREDHQCPGAVRAHATCSRTSWNARKVGDKLHAVWISFLRYGFLEHHRLLVHEHRVVLEFITQIGVGGLYVRGTLVVERGRA